jgi:hypothetical protein
MLKHHNAVSFQIANALKNQIYQENTRFLQKFVSVMSETCICCSLRTLPCILQNKCRDEYPKTSNLYRRTREFDESEGNLTNPNPHLSKSFSLFYVILCLCFLQVKAHVQARSGRTVDRGQSWISLLMVHIHSYGSALQVKVSLLSTYPILFRFNP